MAAAVEAARQSPLEAIPVPALEIFRDSDQLVDESATRAAMARWGGRASILNPDPVEGDDPGSHVIIGNILSPGTTPWAEKQIAKWIGDLR